MLLFKGDKTFEKKNRSVKTFASDLQILYYRFENIESVIKCIRLFVRPSIHPSILFPPPPHDMRMLYLYFNKQVTVCFIQNSNLLSLSLTVLSGHCSSILQSVLLTMSKAFVLTTDTKSTPFIFFMNSNHYPVQQLNDLRTRTFVSLWLIALFLLFTSLCSSRKWIIVQNSPFAVIWCEYHIIYCWIFFDVLCHNKCLIKYKISGEFRWIKCKTIFCV